MDKAPVDNDKKAHHSDEKKNQLAKRLNRIEGQIRGINKMIMEDVYCDEVLHQIFSVESALNGVKKGLLEAHMKSCIISKIENGEHAVMDELMVTIGKMMR